MTGFVNINKRRGATSASETARIRALTHLPCGHMGTLDPMADGVLPVGIGNACRLFDYFLEKRKVYKAVFLFGTDSDTLDTTGNFTMTRGYVPSIGEIRSVLPSFTGKIMQLPPAFSAKNIGGKRAYDLARAGKEIELKPVPVHVYSIDVGETGKDGEYAFTIECGRGTYIRCLARDIAASLGTCAVMSALTRTESGLFKIEDAVGTDSLTVDNIEKHIIPTDSVLTYGKLFLTGGSAAAYSCGRVQDVTEDDGLYSIYLDGIFYGIGEVRGKKLRTRTRL